MILEKIAKQRGQSLFSMIILSIIGEKKFVERFVKKDREDRVLMLSRNKRINWMIVY